MDQAAVYYIRAASPSPPHRDRRAQLEAAPLTSTPAGASQSSAGPGRAPLFLLVRPGPARPNKGPLLGRALRAQNQKDEAGGGPGPGGAGDGRGRTDFHPASSRQRRGHARSPARGSN